VEIVARIEPAREIGGDYYDDFFMVDDRHLGVVIADVAGKGMPAGLFLMILRTELRDHARQTLSAAGNPFPRQQHPRGGQSLAHVRHRVLPDPEPGYGPDRLLHAGHPPPIRLTKSAAAMSTANWPAARAW
jgi:hypothetical protein